MSIESGLPVYPFRLRRTARKEERRTIWRTKLIPFFVFSKFLSQVVAKKNYGWLSAGYRRRSSQANLLFSCSECRLKPRITRARGKSSKKPIQVERLIVPEEREARVASCVLFF